jgi:hypothetical protein
MPRRRKRDDQGPLRLLQTRWIMRFVDQLSGGSKGGFARDGKGWLVAKEQVVDDKGNVIIKIWNERRPQEWADVEPWNRLWLERADYWALFKPFKYDKLRRRLTETGELSYPDENLH